MVIDRWFIQKTWIFLKAQTVHEADLPKCFCQKFLSQAIPIYFSHTWIKSQMIILDLAQNCT